MNAKTMKHEISYAVDKMRSGVSGGDIAPHLAALIAKSYHCGLEEACKVACEIVELAYVAIKAK